MNARVRLSLFGSPSVEHGRTTVALPMERRGQLIALLALRRGWVQRAEVAATLWPEQSQKLAYANLRKTLFRLQAMPWAAGIESQGMALRLDAASDVAEFEAALREQRLPDAVVAYGGELLSGFDDGQSEAWTRWLAFERERLRAAWRGTVLQMLARDPTPAEALVLTTRLLEADPLDEGALREHMNALVAAGQTAAARQAYREFVERLARDLGLEPGAELRSLHESLSGHSVRPPPPEATPTGAGDSFVGRSIELQRIASLLARDECRLLCLIGPGGVGKTSLAQRALRELQGRHADGGVFVALEEVTTPDQFGIRLGHELGLPRGRGSRGDPLAAVVTALGSRQLLLVLDNFEQLEAHAALLDRLLQGCPRLKIIVTSRVRLPVAGEWSMPVEGLPCPDPEDDDRAEAFDAVRLFVNAALRVEPDFAPAPERSAIVEICRLVEGLPLALELAAAWVRVLSCEAIVAELQQGTELLRSRDPARPSRHASIEQVFDQSWRRLGEAERAVLARLSVFRGGFTAEAARVVAAASLPVLGALADKSLLRKDRTRIHLHPLVHQLAAARLTDAEERASAEDAHAAYFQRWLAQNKPAVESGDRAVLLAFDAEFENCRQSWQTALRRGRSAAVGDMARTLLTYCDHRGRIEECQGLLRQAIESPLAAAEPALHAAILSKSAHLSYRLDRYAEAEAEALRALELVRGTRDTATRIQAYNALASCALRQARLPDASRYYKQALALAPPEQLTHNTAATLDNLALVEKGLGHYREAQKLSFESLALHRRIGDSAGVALCLNNLASLHLVLHEPDTAAAHLREALAICERDGLSIRAFVLSNLAEVAMRKGDLDGAIRHADAALEVADATGNRAVQTWAVQQAARIAVRAGHLELAREKLAATLTEAIAIGMPSLRVGGLSCFAELLEAMDERDAARRVMNFTLSQPGITVATRDEVRAEWAGRLQADPPDPPWPGIEFEELLQRVVTEAPMAHGPLIAALRLPVTV